MTGAGSAARGGGIAEEAGPKAGTNAPPPPAPPPPRPEDSPPGGARPGAAPPRPPPAEFAGFEMGLLRDFRVNRGDNKHVVVLPLKNMSESVTVGGANQAADRASRAFGLNVTQEQIQALSDDPAEMARQLSDIAGPDAIFRVDSFEGQQLPPKSQIKSIHVTRDQFAAETEQPGSTFVDVITQPGIGPIRGGANVSFRDGSMSAKSQFTPTKGPEQTRGYGFNIGGALIKDKSNFSLVGQRTEPVRHAQPERRAADRASGSTC